MELLLAICTHIMYISAGLVILIVWAACVTAFGLCVWEKEFGLGAITGFLSLLGSVSLCKTIIFLIKFYHLV
jgi:hypothetical protein